MNFLPVLGRELRVTSRASRLYWGRFTAALLAVGLVAWFWMTMGPGANSAQRAELIFGSLATFAFIYCLLLGGYVTADCISEEKREGTLGLLFLTNLKSHDVVVGKTAAGSLRAIYTLIAIFPVLTIPILLGGLSGGMIFRMTLVLVNTLFFTLCLGLFISACSQHDRKAQVGAFVTMLVFTLGLPGLISVLKYEFRWTIHEGWFGLSPGAAFFNAFDKPYARSSQLFWIALAIPHFLAWCAFGGATIVVRRAWQDNPAGTGGAGRWTRLKNWARGSAAARSRYRRRLLNISPYYWLAARDRLKPYYVAIFLGGCAFFWFLLWSYNRRDMLEQVAFFITAVLLHTSMKLWISTEAGRQLYDDRRNSGLELTLSTPLTVREIIEGQFLALLRQFGWAVGLVILFDIVGMVMGARMRLYGAESEWILGWAAIMIVLLVDAGTIAAVGMWLGLTCRRSSRAVAQTLGCVLFLPWLILFGIVTINAISGFQGGGDSSKAFIGSYLVVSLLTDLGLFLWAYGNLTSRFREVAVQRFDRAGREK
jgi:ABC-type transport system involved in cytochrome c biogenesis permease component